MPSSLQTSWVIVCFLFSVPSYLPSNFPLAIDALIVGIETQDTYVANKKTWTRKIVVVTDGENPIEIEDWEATVQKMNALAIGLTIVYVICSEKFGLH